MKFQIYFIFLWVSLQFCSPGSRSGSIRLKSMRIRNTGKKHNCLRFRTKTQAINFFVEQYGTSERYRYYKVKKMFLYERRKKILPSDLQIHSSNTCGHCSPYNYLYSRTTDSFLIWKGAEAFQMLCIIWSIIFAGMGWILSISRIQGGGEGVGGGRALAE